MQRWQVGETKERRMKMKRNKRNLRVLAVVLVTAVLVGWFPAIQAKAEAEEFTGYYQTFEGWYIRDNPPVDDRDWRVDLKFNPESRYGTKGDVIGYGRVIAQKYVWNKKRLTNEAKFLYFKEGKIRRVGFNMFKLYLPKHKYVKFTVVNGIQSPYVVEVVKTNIKVKKMGKVKTPKGSYTMGNDWYTDDWTY